MYATDPDDGVVQGDAAQRENLIASGVSRREARQRLAGRYLDEELGPELGEELDGAVPAHGFRDGGGEVVEYHGAVGRQPPGGIAVVRDARDAGRGGGQLRAQGAGHGRERRTVRQDVY